MESSRGGQKGNVSFSSSSPQKTFVITVPGKTPGAPSRKVTLRSSDPNININDLIAQGIIKIDPNTGSVSVLSQDGGGSSATVATPGTSQQEMNEISSPGSNTSTTITVRPKSPPATISTSSTVYLPVGGNSQVVPSGGSITNVTPDGERAQKQLVLSGEGGGCTVQRESVPVTFPGGEGELRQYTVKGQVGNLGEGTGEMTTGEMKIQEGAFKSVGPGGVHQEVSMHQTQSSRRTMRIVSPQQSGAVQVLNDCGLGGAAQMVQAFQQTHPGVVTVTDPDGKLLVPVNETGTEMTPENDMQYTVKSLQTHTHVVTKTSRRSFMQW